MWMISVGVVQSFFQLNVIDHIKKKFVIKSEETSVFKYLGLDVKQKDGMIRLSQDEYVKSLKPISVDNKTHEKEMRCVECKEKFESLDKIIEHINKNECGGWTCCETYLRKQEEKEYRNKN